MHHEIKFFNVQKFQFYGTIHFELPQITKNGNLGNVNA